MDSISVKAKSNKVKRKLHGHVNHCLGFICGICNNGNELFPFDAFVSNCGKCGAVYQ